MSSKRHTGVTLCAQKGTKGRRSAAPKIVFTSLVLSLLPLASCSDGSPFGPATPISDAVVASRQYRIEDLRVVGTTETTLTIQWTQVDDGTGQPAWYRVKYSRPPVDWREADVGCERTIRGEQIGAPMSCTIEGLEGETDYEVLMMSYRLDGGRWADARYSNVVAGRTAAAQAVAVTDLTVSGATETTLSAEWTQVDDGTGEPSSYRLKYAAPPIDWKLAEVGCERTLVGEEIGTKMSCTITGLEPSTEYEVQLMSYRLEDGSWRGAVYSNVARGTTGDRRSIEPAGSVGDLHVSLTTDSSLTLEWTQVDDGTGEPGAYQLKYAAPPIDWGSAIDGCGGVLEGDGVGRTMSCTVTGLDPDTEYDLQVLASRLQEGSAVADGSTAADRLSNVARGRTDPAGPQPPTPPGTSVQDLHLVAASATSATLQWTQVDDGTGAPALYRVKYAIPPIDYATATIGCDPSIQGTAIGATLSCTVMGLAPATTYDLQLMSYRTVDGVWQDAQYSNVASVTTDSAPLSTEGIWISPAELSLLPMFGAGWENLLDVAIGSCGVPDLSNQDQSTNVCIMGKALMFARTWLPGYRDDVADAIRSIAYDGTYVGRALALGRELGAYVIAADLIDLKNYDPALDARFRDKLVELRTTYTSGAARNLIDCHERRPNNWGTMCGATRAAIAVYLGDAQELARTAQVFKGYLGDRASYAGFEYGDDLSWQCDPSRPVGINPVGCVKNGLSLDGVLPDDQRRGGSFTTSPPRENYVWEALQGALMQAVILHRSGYAAFEWEDRALLRAVEWLHEIVDFPAQGDDTWLPYIVNHYYGTSFPTVYPARTGKNAGWTDWTLR